MSKASRAAGCRLALLLAAPLAAAAGAGDPAGFLRALSEEDTTCQARSLNALPPPALVSYRECYGALLEETSTFDWSVPGARQEARRQCWCQSNLTSTMEAFHCCGHQDVDEWCRVDCDADCSSDLAQQCISQCPAMCLEAQFGEYSVDSRLCQACNWTACFPVIGCITAHAQERSEEPNATATCHEPEFKRSPQLQEYQSCWEAVPKHSSHWNILSSIRYCACRADMATAARDNDCCASRLYGGGVCELSCKSEADCQTQAAQSCIQSCQWKCPSHSNHPSEQCVQDCLGSNAPCKPYLTCRPPQTAGYVCDDGRYPDAASGCCYHNQTERSSTVSCPRLCTSQQVWRVDTDKGLPYWARRSSMPLLQCTCDGCPRSSTEGVEMLTAEVASDIWANGQMMLMDIARNEGLQLGPNRRMQELMLERNAQLQELIDSADSQDPAALNAQIEHINQMYTQAIIEAARQYPDDGQADQVIRERGGQHHSSDGGSLPVLVVLVVCLFGCCSAAVLVALLYRRRAQQAARNVEGCGQVVLGNPVAEGNAALGSTVQDGTAVPQAGAAPAKGGAAPSKGETVEM